MSGMTETVAVGTGKTRRVARSRRIDRENSLTPAEAAEVERIGKTLPGVWLTQTDLTDDLPGDPLRRDAAIMTGFGHLPFNVVVSVARKNGKLHAFAAIQGSGSFDEGDKSPPVHSVAEAIEWGRQWLRSLLLDTCGWMLGASGGGSVTANF